MTVNSLYLFVPILIPNTETQVMFNESNKNSYISTCDSWYTERKLSTDGNELQVDFGAAQHVNSPKSLVASFQAADRIAAPDKKIPIYQFSIMSMEKNLFIERDGYRYPKDAVLSNFPGKDYLDQ